MRSEKVFSEMLTNSFGYDQDFSSGSAIMEINPEKFLEDSFQLFQNLKATDHYFKQ